MSESSRRTRLDLPSHNSGRRSVSPSGASIERIASTLYGTSQEGTMMDENLIPPSVPFGSSKDGGGGGSGASSRRTSFSSLATDSKAAARQSLSVNYVPAKFTKLHAPGVHAHHNTRRAKMGGGRDAFAADAGRMGAMGTMDDDEGIVFQMGKRGLKTKHAPKLRWNRFKWILFTANTVLIVYGLATLISAILVWLNVFYDSAVIRAGNNTELIISTIAAAVITLTSLLGYSGILLNNRAFCAVYTLMLWVCLALLVTPGYMTYKWRTFNLEGKLNSQWSRGLGETGRLHIQDALRCCGYYSPFVEATISPLCYPRSNLEGCKNKFLKVERTVLDIWYTISFSLVPAHILIILAALLCSNHITYRFGKGVTPKRYRLDLGSMAVIMDEYASQIAAKYGPEVAVTAVTNSSSALNDLEIVPTVSRNSHLTAGSSHGVSSGLTRPTSRTPYAQATSPSLFVDDMGDSRGSISTAGTSGPFGIESEVAREMGADQGWSRPERSGDRGAPVEMGTPNFGDPRASRWTNDEDADVAARYADVEDERTGWAR